MRTKKLTTGIAGVGVVAGAAGLVFAALPSSAGAAPALPTITPEALVTSVLAAKPTAFGGTVTAESNLGIPVPGMSPNSDGNYSAKVYADQQDRHRVVLDAQGGGRHTVVEDGNTVWSYDSTKHQVTKTAVPQQAKDRLRADATKDDPATMAKKLINTVQQSSTVSIDGTASVAGRDAYQLVLTPKPTEKTLVREVRVAVDAATRMPLQFEMFGNGTSAPALQVGFSQLTVGPQDPALFTFTPPAGVKVVTVDPSQHMQRPKQQDQPEPTITGQGWDTVVSGKLPKDALSALQGNGQQGNGQQGKNGAQAQQLLDRFAKPVTGSFGSGRMVQTTVGTALLTSDGRFAAGLVPEQVLEQALAR